MFEGERSRPIDVARGWVRGAVRRLFFPRNAVVGTDNIRPDLLNPSGVLGFLLDLQVTRKNPYGI